MDSKLRGAAILTSLAGILLVAVLVVYVNRQPGGSRTPYVPQPTSAPAETGSGGGESLPEGQIGNNLSAFLEDDWFWDPEESFLWKELEERERLSLIVTSVERDLRIQILDADGRLVTGKSFFVRLRDGKDSGETSEYKDLDQDGVLYIAELAAGDYYVELLPVDGYRVPENATRVLVKDHVEYVPIEDISLLLLTEADIDAEVEDTGQNEALEDADLSEIKVLQNAGTPNAGIDVSKWNGTIDWDRVKNAGVSYAIIRCGYRGSSTGSLVQDPLFEQNIRGATAAGVKVGVYFFTQAVDEKEAVEEASAVLEMVRDYRLAYPIYIDTEGAGANGRANNLDQETRTLVCEAFCRTIQNAGYDAGVYASRHWYNNRLFANRLEDYSIWLAEYRSVPLYQGYYEMWQYTSRGAVDGIEGNVDLNISYR